MVCLGRARWPCRADIASPGARPPSALDPSPLQSYPRSYETPRAACRAGLGFLFSFGFFATVRAETESIDLKSLAKKARPAVMLLVVSDASGKEIATGTGFLVSSDGKLITNHHVIEGAASAVAKAENGGLFPVEGVLADDPKNDLVLLKIKGKDLPFLTLGTNATDRGRHPHRRHRQPAWFGRDTVGRNRLGCARVDGEGGFCKSLLRSHRAPSGSPVMNAKGDVVGIASGLLRGGQALNFAVPASVVRRLIAVGNSVNTLPPLERIDRG